MNKNLIPSLLLSMAMGQVRAMESLNDASKVTLMDVSGDAQKTTAEIMDVTKVQETVPSIDVQEAAAPAETPKPEGVVPVPVETATEDEVAAEVPAEEITPTPAAPLEEVVPEKEEPKTGFAGFIDKIKCWFSSLFGREDKAKAPEPTAKDAVEETPAGDQVQE